MNEACRSVIFVEYLRVVQKAVLISDCIRLRTDVQISLVLQLLAKITVHPARATYIMVAKLLELRKSHLIQESDKVL